MIEYEEIFFSANKINETEVQENDKGIRINWKKLDEKFPMILLQILPIDLRKTFTQLYPTFWIKIQLI